MKWLLFFLGTVGYFIIRLDGRTDKSKKLDFNFWIADNWIQLAGAFILDLIAVILLTDERINLTVWLSKYVPDGLVVLAVLAIPAGCGLGLGWGAYELIKVFLKKKADKVINE